MDMYSYKQPNLYKNYFYSSKTKDNKGMACIFVVVGDGKMNGNKNVACSHIHFLYLELFNMNYFDCLKANAFHIYDCLEYKLC